MSAVPSRRERWDARYAARRDLPPRPPDPFVLEALDLLARPPGFALDLACGAGRHALLLARQGWRVEAWDFSTVALGILGERAEAEALEIAVRQADLDDPGIAPPLPHPDLVLLVSCFQPALLARLPEWLPPGGHLLAAVATEDWPGERPPAHFRYRSGVFRKGLQGLETVLHQEEGGRAGLLARRPSGA